MDMLWGCRAGLSEEKLQKIHETSLRILEEIGIRVASEYGRNLLLKNGCRELNKQYISIPSRLVEQSISQSQYFALYDREQRRAIEFGSENTYIHNFGAVSTILDTDTNVLRQTNTQDAIDSYRILDQLDHVHLAGPLVTVTEVDVRLTQIISAAIALQNCAKPVYFTMINGQETIAAVKLLTAAAGSAENLHKYPRAIIYASAISPLFFNDDCFSVIREAALAGVPLASLSCPTMGLTAPMSMAGALALQNAETLAFNVIAKLINPEVPVVYGARLGFANMKNAQRTSGYPEEGILGAAVAQLARKYRMVSDVYGLGARTYSPHDVQQGYEKAICAFPPILAGADMVSGVGHMASGAMTCFETLLVDDEMCGMMLKAAKGIGTSLDDLAFDAIQEVTEDEETFITHEHTIEYLHKKELWSGGLGIECSFEKWKNSHGISVADHAKERVHEILSQTNPLPVIGAVDDALREIVCGLGLSMDGIRTR